MAEVAGTEPPLAVACVRFALQFPPVTVGKCSLVFLPPSIWSLRTSGMRRREKLPQ